MDASLKRLAGLPLPQRFRGWVRNIISGIPEALIERSLGCKRAIVVTGPRGKSDGQAVLDALPQEMVAGIYSNATMHTPVDVTADALKYANEVSADCAIAVGGGSAVGLTKALALHSDGRIKQIAVPTTYSGSEATSILGQLKDGIKTTQTSMTVLPQVIVYDVDLTMDLSAQMTITSGMNAIAHAVEALYATECSPLIELMALQGIECLSKALPSLSKDLRNKEGRSDALYGAWTCATCLGAVGMALHHKMCHVLGGSFGLPHAEVHTVVLRHATAYNAPYTQEAMAKISNLFGGVSPARGLYDLARNNGAPYSLKALGMKEGDLEKAVDLALKTPYPNPAPLEREKLLQMLRNAYDGVRPE